LEAADSLDQLDLRKAVFSLSGKLRTLDGAFELREDGAQLGELSPVGQLRDGAHMTVVYPPDIATGKPEIPAR
jgi:branched-chain amino acid transport system substrate-binding protein